jgi:ACS family glucarate transporter-like MFS transporter
LYFGAAANWVSGATVDTLYRKGWGRRSRALPAAAGFLLGTAALLAAAKSQTIGSAVTWFAIATFGVDVTLSPSWTVCIDIGGDRAGTLSGAMNMAGNIGSFASSVAFPVLLRWTGNSNTYFFGAAALNLVAALVWLTMSRGDSARTGRISV